MAGFEFIFTEPAFIPNNMTDKLSKERRQTYIPKQQRERDLYGSAFEIQLINKLTQRALAKECAKWIYQYLRNNLNFILFFKALLCLLQHSKLIYHYGIFTKLNFERHFSKRWMLNQRIKHLEIPNRTLLLTERVLQTYLAKPLIVFEGRFGKSFSMGYPTHLRTANSH